MTATPTPIPAELDRILVSVRQLVANEAKVPIHRITADTPLRTGDYMLDSLDVQIVLAGLAHEFNLPDVDPAEEQARFVTPRTLSLHVARHLPARGTGST